MKTTLLIGATIIISLFSSSQVNAVEMPLAEKQVYIEKKSKYINVKKDIFGDVHEDLEALEEKRSNLLAKLETDKKAVEELKAKIAEKKEAERKERERKEAERKRIAAEKKRAEELRKQVVSPARYAVNSAGNGYVPGNCTWYVKSVRPDLPNNLGNANTWYSNAAARGWKVGATPRVGAVAATTAGYYGHVAYVIGVSADGQHVTIREMNYGGLYRMNTRTVHYTQFRYIYNL